MKKAISVGVSGLVLAMFAGPQAALAAKFEAKSVSFQDIVGDVNITTNNGTEIEVVIAQGDEYHEVSVKEVDGKVEIIGAPWKDKDVENCCDNRITQYTNLRKDRKLSSGPERDDAFFARYPTITVSMPINGDVAFEDARIKLAMEELNGALHLDACYVYGETADLDEAVINLIHGSRLIVGDIEAGAEVDISGDADVKIGDTPNIDVDIAGPGDVILGTVDGMMDVSIAGSGTVRSARHVGPLTVRIAGSGAVDVKEGTADSLKAIIDGSGGVFFNGQATRPDLRLRGSSQVHLKSVKGRINHYGGGAVFVGGELQDAE